MKVRRRVFGDTPSEEHDVQNNAELLAIQWIKDIWIKGKDTIAYSPSDSTIRKHTHLMAVRGDSYFVIGFIEGDGSELGLVDYNTLVKK